MNSLNPFSYLKEDESNDLKKNKGKKKYQKKQYILMIKKQILNQIIYQNQFDASSTINLFIGMQVSRDGVFRHFQTLDNLSFGYNQQQIEKVVEDKHYGLVNIVFEKNSQAPISDLSEAIKFLSSNPNIPFQQIFDLLQKLYYFKEVVQAQIEKLEINQALLSQKEAETQIFLQNFQQILFNYHQTNQFKMYWYSVFRINYQIQNTEIIHTGFSKAYLELLGIDSDTLSQIFLRGKKVDLIRNSIDISLLTLQGLQLLGQSLEGQCSPVVTQIVTFDGFPLTITQQKTYSCLLEIQNEQFKYNDFGYNIVEVDVNTKDLQQLIEYRQRISERCGDIKIEDLIKRELSYLFEDVEYSIKSQNFIEKFYSDNINQLKCIEEEKSQIFKNRRCSYRQVNK
ncbi:hypothetical protein TTHERM_00327160 (macronuclear) [Tetrahymena thermophila SB210]|uniref:Uncharacterized protein n=1 Tax=Tetrahymena thermophila (strain SB210) TaxID=312017 RepID=I7M4C8_TETTS|nr:hypothetical protein TTHERM_00327160 [Tetrahymena thermophila SB210]EAS06234.1 hypothetical protein TTHERM_00327160 [Tetrahymena thermophila SB210]|eukprot:XP_001026479.1 hypothetical protein TTHERM_00327160 [Tetrahymena thermophila SB210]